MVKKLLLFSILIGVLPSLTFAATLSFTATPAKVEVALPPGGAKIVSLSLINNLGHIATFNLSVEKLADYNSLIPYLDLPAEAITLQPGERRNIPVAINLPLNVPLGSLQGLVIITLAPTSETVAGARAVSRLGVLFLIRVSGTEKFSGKLTSFGLAGGAFTSHSDKLDFYLNYQNDGNVYVNPYGLITIKNLLTKQEQKVKVEPWYVLPASARVLDLKANLAGAGLYTATLELNRGYDNVVDTKQIYFIVLTPVVRVIIGIILLLILFGLYRVVKSRLLKQ